MRNIRKERLIEMIKLFFRRSTNKHKKQHYMMTWLFVWPQKMQKKNINYQQMNIKVTNMKRYGRLSYWNSLCKEWFSFVCVVIW